MNIISLAVHAIRAQHPMKIAADAQLSAIGYRPSTIFTAVFNIVARVVNPMSMLTNVLVAVCVIALIVIVVLIVMGRRASSLRAAEVARAQDDLACRLRYADVLAHCSRVLMNPGNSDASYHEALVQTLDLLRVAVGASRIVVFHNPAWKHASAGDSDAYRMIGTAYTPGLSAQREPTPEELHDRPAEMTRGASFNGPVVGRFPENPSFQRYLDDNQIRSAFFYPLTMRGRAWGHLSITDHVRTYVWDDAAAQMLRTAGEMIAAFVQCWETERALLQAKELADSVDRDKLAFLASMSHEIRTPLNAVIGVADLLIDTPLSPEQREYVATIRIGGESLLEAISSIPDISKVGSTLTATLPLDLVDPGSRVPPDPDAPPLRVLVAEDNLINQRVTLHLLSRLGLQADVVANGKDAVDSVMSSNAYDVVLMDIHMPDMDGIEATRKIRALGQQIHQPQIVALTADALGNGREQALLAGMDGYLYKPVSLDDLHRILITISQKLRPAVSPVLIDWHALQELVDAFDLPAPQAAESIYGLFYEEIGKQLAELELAMANTDRVKLARMAHRLRGGLSQLGARSIADLGAQIEKAAPNADWEELATHVITLRTRYNETVALVREHYHLSESSLPM